VDVLGHPTGRLILKREPHKADMTRVIAAAAQAGVAMEINCQIDRLDLDDVLARHAAAAGVPIVISTDAHSATALGGLRWGVTIARRAWLTAGQVLNTRSLPDLRAALRRNRR
jgi:DNA polymerase (family 10)